MRQPDLFQHRDGGRRVGRRDQGAQRHCHSPRHRRHEPVSHDCDGHRGHADRNQNQAGQGNPVLVEVPQRAVERGVVDIGLLLKRNHDHLLSLTPPQAKLNISSEDLALPVFGSAAQFGQLITNLCLNARDALGDSSGVIEVSARLATQRYRERSKRIRSTTPSKGGYSAAPTTISRARWHAALQSDSMP